MEQRAVCHWAGQIGRPATARGKQAIHGQNAPIIIKAQIVIYAEIMALAGDFHILIAVGPQFDSAAKCALRPRRPRRKTGSSGFLCRQSRRPCGAHSPPPHWQAHPGMGNHMLRLAWVLGRGEDGDLIILAGDGQCNLAFQIHMVLAAHMKAPLDAVGGAARAGAISPRSSFRGAVTLGRPIAATALSISVAWGKGA
jgi:hypothetical protein